MYKIKSKNSISILFVITVIFFQFCFSTLALNGDSTFEDSLIGQVQENQPVMASGNCYVQFSTSMANQVAQYHGYRGAEALKADYGFGSNANLYRNTGTGEIMIITSTGSVTPTGLYGGWKS